MRLRLFVVFAAAAFLSSPANAALIDSVTLSDLSSEESGSTCEPGCTDVVTADQLDATLTFTVADNGPDLDITLTLSNDTDDPPAGTFKINEVYFNLSGISSLSSVSLNGWTMSTDACAVGSSTTGVSPCDDPGGSGTKADGFGIFDVALKTNGGGALAAGSSLNFTFTVTGGAGTQAEAFTSALSRDSEAGGNILSIAAAKFIEGPAINCPGEEFLCDSGFGANQPGLVPEPASLGLVLMGLTGLAWQVRRR